MDRLCIYAIRNVITGYVYIGQTKHTIERRKKEHLYCLQNNKHRNCHLQHAYNLYGESAFIFEVLEYCSKEELDRKEVQYISKQRKIGKCYNFEGGGTHKTSISDETRAKMSAVQKARASEEEYKKKMRPFWDKMQIPVFCITDALWFDSLSIAAEFYGIQLETVRKCAKKKQPCCYSSSLNKFLMFSYKEEQISKEEKERAISRYKLLGKANGNILCVTTGETFRTATEAAKKYGLHQPNISKCLRGERSSCGKTADGKPLIWSYADEPEKKIPQAIGHYGKNNPLSKPVMCIETGEIFDSCGLAAIHYNSSQSKISMVCHGKRKHAGKGADGKPLSWKFI